MRIDTHRHNAFWDEWRSEVRMEGTLTTTITTTINKPSPTAVDNHSWYCNHFFNCSQSFSYSTVKVWVLGGPIPRSVDLPDYWNIENKWIPNPVETRYRWTMLHYGVRWWITTTTTDKVTLRLMFDKCLSSFHNLKHCEKLFIGKTFYSVGSSW